MKRSDPEFTKLLGNHLINAKGFYDWGIGHGLTSPEEVRLTVEKRKEMAKQLVDGGMSKRKAAQALGVSEGTVRGDLSAQKSRKNAQELRTIEPMPTEEEADADWQDAVFESACRLVDERMTSETRKRFFVHIMESYAHEI
jgi:hypothetical protein